MILTTFLSQDKIIKNSWQIRKQFKLYNGMMSDWRWRLQTTIRSPSWPFKSHKLCKWVPESPNQARISEVAESRTKHSTNDEGKTSQSATWKTKNDDDDDDVSLATLGSHASLQYSYHSQEILTFPKSTNLCIRLPTTWSAWSSRHFTFTNRIHSNNKQVSRCSYQNSH